MVFVSIIFLCIIIYNFAVSPCTSVPCLNNGQCEYSVNAPYYKCDCPGGFKGEKCEGNMYIKIRL